MKNNIKISSFDILIYIILIEIFLLILFNLELDIENIYTILTAIVTSTGIFSAIIISFFLSSFNRHLSKRDFLNGVLEMGFKKVTLFRKFLYYIMEFNKIWGEDYKHFKKLSKTNKSHLQLNNEIPEGIDDRKIQLFLAMKSIVDLRDDLNDFIMPFTKYSYSLETLIKYQRESNLLWFYIFHKPARDVIFENQSIDINLKENFIDIAKKLISKDFKEEDFNKELIADLGSYFSLEILPEIIENLRNKTKPLPRGLTILIIQLFILLLVGLILPIIVMATDLIAYFVISKICIAAVVIILFFFLYSFFKYYKNETKINGHNF